MTAWFITYLWHTVYRRACFWIETQYDKRQPIVWTCDGCGRTSKEYK